MSGTKNPLTEMGNLQIHDQNKPDFKEFDMGFVSGRRSWVSGANVLDKKCGNGSTGGGGSTPEKLRSAAEGRGSKPGHRRSSSTGAPLIYSGGGYNLNTSGSTSTSTSSSTTSNSGGGGGGVSGGSGTSVSSAYTHLYPSACGGGGGGNGGSGCTSGGTSVSSPNTHLYPSGNICPSGKILKSNMGSSRASTRSEVLGLGTGNYGHGSIIKGGGGKMDGNGELGLFKRAMSSSDLEEVKMAGNELYRRGNFADAIELYDRAIAISPENAACRSNRAAALTMLGRLGEAVRECEEAVRLDPGFKRAHQRLASLYLRLGQVESARHHISQCLRTDVIEMQKLSSVEKHISRCSDARKIGDWQGVLRECDAAMLAGAVSSPQIIACKAEAFLKLHQLEDANSTILDLPQLDPYPPTCSQVKFFGMLSEAYVLCIRAQVDMALGRFETAATAVEKAGLIDYSNIEVAMLLSNVKLVEKARARGKDLFDSGRYSEACSAYGDGLKYNLSNAVLYCNRAVCWSKLGLWEKSVEDCNEALKIHPKYTKALLRRAASNAKLERWRDAVRDYEVLRKEIPGDNEVTESLFCVQEAMKRSGLTESSSSLDCTKSVNVSPGFCKAEPNAKPLKQNKIPDL